MLNIDVVHTMSDDDKPVCRRIMDYYEKMANELEFILNQVEVSSESHGLASWILAKMMNAQDA